MAAQKLARLLRWYPPAWRDRYGDEVAIYMEDRFGPGRPPLAARLSLVLGGMRERSRRSGLTGDSVPRPERVRAGTVVVLASWTVFVIAGSSFAKLSEHFDNALPNGAGPHHLPDLAYTVVETVATVAGLMVAGGVALAVPAFARFLRSGGWTSVRGHVIRAAACTVVTAGMTIPLLLWAHDLTNYQRNGGLAAYSVLFLAWAALVALTLGLWTVLLVAATKRVTFSHRLLVSEALLAVAVAAAMVVMVGATALWWAAVTGDAPSFFGGGLAADLRLIATIGLMTLAAAAGIGGVVRIARTWPTVREALPADRP